MHLPITINPSLDPDLLIAYTTKVYSYPNSAWKAKKGMVTICSNPVNSSTTRYLVALNESFHAKLIILLPGWQSIDLNGSGLRCCNSGSSGY
jgi:hypothetical protein